MMTEIDDEIDEDVDVDESDYPVEVDDDVAVYNLVEDADLDCLYGDCEHFCGEPTQYDLARLERNGYADEVGRYEEQRDNE